MDSGESLSCDPVIQLITPDTLALPATGLSLRWPDTPLDLEAARSGIHGLELGFAHSLTRQPCRARSIRP
jgi:hypothetical protein